MPRYAVAHKAKYCVYQNLPCAVESELHCEQAESNLILCWILALLLSSQSSG